MAVHILFIQSNKGDVIMTMRATVPVSMLAATLLLSAGFAAAAADQERTQEMAQAQDQERIYGSQLMTRQERVEYRAKIRAAKTVEERERIRKEHHEKMKERAKARGVTLPDEAPAGGGGMGSGGGMGQGGGRAR
jgi:hypothetical protein